MRLHKPNIERLAARGDRRGLAKALADHDAAVRHAAAAALLAGTLTADEITALSPVLAEVSRGSSAAEQDLCGALVTAFGRARRRPALPALLALVRDDGIPPGLRQAAAAAAEAVQPGAADPLCQTSDSPAELEPRTLMENGLLTRNGLAALRSFLERMPLCGVFCTPDRIGVHLTAREAALRTDPQAFRDRRLKGPADHSGTLDETCQAVLDGLYRIVADLGRKNLTSERAVIQPCEREGIPGLAEVRTLFGIEFGYVDLVARGDRDWFYYWGTEA